MTKYNYEQALKYVVDRFAGRPDKSGYPEVLHSISVSIRLKKIFEMARAENEAINRGDTNKEGNTLLYSFWQLYSIRYQYMTIAVLHDIVEDLHIDIDDIGILFGEDISHRLIHMTNPGGNRNYKNYLNNLIAYGDNFMIVIKLCDISDNMDRLESLPREDREFLINKYTEARKTLYAELKKRGYTDACDVKGL